MKSEHSDLLAPTPPEPGTAASTGGGLVRRILSLLPFAVIACLLYAALFVRPAVTSKSVPPPVIEKRDRFYGVAMTEEHDVWAVGNDGKIVRSADEGRTWRAQSSGTDAHLQAIAAWDTQRAVAVGNKGTVLVTADGGVQWRPASVPATEFNPKLIRVRAVSATRAWAVGEMGTVLVSDDSGESWRTAEMKTDDMYWNDVGFFGAHGCLVGEFGHIRCSQDGGVTWRDVDAPVKTSLNSLAFRNEREVVAVGLEGVALYSNDSGMHWSVLPKATQLHLYDVVWDGLRWIAVGDRGVAVASDEQGTRWSDVTKEFDSAAWRTQIVGAEGRYAMAGQGIKLVGRPGQLH